MMDTAFHFPRPLGQLVTHLPSFPPSFALTKVLNLALNRIVRGGDLGDLYNKKIAIHVTDAGLHLYFTIQPEGFSAISACASPDLAISATAHDFYLLATRKEDPDTLFFNRRLVVEGDTELGLIAKNTLDGIELPNIGMLAPKQILSRIKSIFL